MERNKAILRRESAPANIETSAVSTKSEVKGMVSTASNLMGEPQSSMEFNSGNRT